MMTWWNSPPGHAKTEAQPSDVVAVGSHVYATDIVSEEVVSAGMVKMSWAATQRRPPAVTTAPPPRMPSRPFPLASAALLEKG
jgi:hypothetical protein